MAVLAVLTVVSRSDWNDLLGIPELKQKHLEKETAEGDLQEIEVSRKWVSEERWETKGIQKIYLAALTEKY